MNGVDYAQRAFGSLPSGATFSEPDRTYRYALWRIWDPATPSLNVIGLNPSTADEHADDPTIRRCKDFARRWGLGGLVMTNLFAYRATDPRDMRAAVDPVGPDNDKTLVLEAQIAGRVLAAWGVHGNHRQRVATVLTLLEAASVEVCCLGTTQNGAPRHPLYVPAVTQPIALLAAHCAIEVPA